MDAQHKLGQKADVLFYPILFTAIAAAFAYFLAITSLVSREGDLVGSLGEWLKNKYIVMYAFTVVVFFAVLLFLRCLARFVPVVAERLNKVQLPWKWACVLFCALLLAAIILLLHRLFVSELIEFGFFPAKMPVRRLPKLLTFGINGLALMIPAYLFYKKRDVDGIARFGVYALVILLSFWSLYTKNFFVGDTWHPVAYYETISNVVDFTPFSIETMGIYGYYGLLYFLPVRLLMLVVSKPTAIFMCIAFFGALATACCLYVFEVVLQKNWHKICAALAVVLPVAVVRPSHYWQAQPHRVLFPCLLIAFCAYLWKKNIRLSNSRLRYIGYGIASAAFVWNVETGLYCFVAFTVYWAVQEWQTEKWYSVKMLMLYLRGIALSVCGVAAAFALVNFYNICCGGDFVFKNYFFPIFEQSYMVDALFIMLPVGNYGWAYVLFFSLLLLGLAMRQTLWFRQSAVQCNPQAPLVAATASLMFLNLMYYMNRSVFYNLDICYQLVVVALALLIGKENITLPCKGSCYTLSEIGKKTIRTLSLLIVSCLAVQIMYAVPNLFEKANIGIWDEANLQMDAQKIRETVPENTYGVGLGMSFLYETLGWDNYGRFRDSSDLLVGGTQAFDAVCAQILKQDAFVTTSSPFDTQVIDAVLAQDPRYEFVAAVPVQEYNLLYYKR